MKTPSKNALWVVSLAVAVSFSMLAQSSVTSKQLLLSMAMNTKRLVQYEWKQRITVVRHGTPAEPIVDQVRFDSTGQMQRTVISAPPEKQMSGIRGRVAAGVKENVKEMMELAGRYNKPQQMKTAIEKAQVSSDAGAIRLQSSALINPGDSMTIVADPTTHLAKHIDITTEYEGGPMTIAQDYAPVPDGPNVMKTMRVAAPKKDLVVNVESYDFAPQSASAKP